MGDENLGDVRSSGSRNKKLIVGIIVVVVIGVLIGGYFMFIGGSKESGEVESNKEENLLSEDEKNIESPEPEIIKYDKFSVIVPDYLEDKGIAQGGMQFLKYDEDSSFLVATTANEMDYAALTEGHQAMIDLLEGSLESASGYDVECNEDTSADSWFSGELAFTCDYSGIGIRDYYLVNSIVSSDTMSKSLEIFLIRIQSKNLPISEDLGFKFKDFVKNNVIID